MVCLQLMSLSSGSNSRRTGSARPGCKALGQMASATAGREPVWGSSTC